MRAAVLLFFDAKDVGGTAVGDQEIRAVVGADEFSERFDSREQTYEIILVAECKDGGDQIVAHALLA